MDILTVMQLAAEVEDRAALLYHSFSGRFRRTPPGCEFWERISIEEKRHADMARTYRRQRLLLPVRPGGHAPVLEQLEAAHSFVLARLRDAGQESIGAALSTAYALEGLLEHAHLDHATEVRDPLLSRLLCRLGQEDRHHQEQLVRLARSVGAP